MDSDLLNTDGPMTRSRLRARKSGMTPVAGAMGAATPNLLQDTPMARELFTDKTNILDQARPIPGNGKDVSPTHGWIGKATTGDLFQVSFDVDREPPVTPNLFVNAQKPDLQNVTPSCSACVHGPTPANTPAAGCVAELPAPNLLSQAVNELKGEEHAMHDCNVQDMSGTGNIKENDDTQDLIAGTEEVMEHFEEEQQEANMEEHMEDMEEHIEDIDPAISEILRELDDYVLDSPDGDSPHQAAQIPEALGMEAETCAAACDTNLAGTPSADATEALLPQDAASSIAAERASDYKVTPGKCADVAPSCEAPSTQCGGIVRDEETRHTAIEALPVSAGPYSKAQAAEDDPSEAVVLQASPEMVVNLAAAASRSVIADEQSPIQLQAAGREDDLPTPGFFQPGASFMSQTVGSPATPEDAPIKPLSFAKSAGSQFATPEIPIHCGMTPMTTMEERQAQKHIPAWNRVSKVVEKQNPLVSKIVQGLWYAPSEQPAWAKTPFMLLHAVCMAKGWGLTVSPETEARIGAGSSIVATVNMPSPTLEGGRTFTATGKNMGNLEALLLAAAGVLEKLLKEHLITGKDATAAMNAAPSTLKSGSVPAIVGSTLHFGQVSTISSFAAARAKFTPQQGRPPVPVAPRSARPSMSVPTVDLSTPMEGSPHLGIGVRAPVQMAATPELFPVPSPVGSLAASAKQSSKQVTPVYHPPMRTGTSSVRSKNKATIAAAAKPTGLRALQEQQKELIRNMKKENDIMAELTKSVGKISIGAKSHTPLRGVPVPKGSCIVFDDEGKASEVEQRDLLRGVPLSRGTHTYFE